MESFLVALSLMGNVASAAILIGWLLHRDWGARRRRKEDEEFLAFVRDPTNWKKPNNPCSQ